jgi:hypothetical protein
VPPSGAACRTASLAIIPLAPGRSSTTTVTPRARLISSPRMRASAAGRESDDEL